MKTTDIRTELELLVNRPTATAFVKASFDRLLLIFRAMRNRNEVISVQELNDQQLADIGLTRDDVRQALAAPWYDDPSSYLTQSARRRRAR